MITNRSGMMIILSSPSGAGKTTLAKMIAKQNSDFVVSVSYTTRKPRPHEQDGKDYYFVDINEFKRLISDNYFFEYAQVFDNYYGTAKKNVLKYLSLGKNVLFDIDWQGTQQLKKRITDQKLVTIFILPPGIEVLRNRLVNRDQDGKQLAKHRMKIFKKEVLHWTEYDYVVINNDLNDCYDQIFSIINLEKEGKKFTYDVQTIEKTIENLLK